jgi:hypothetical protein
MEQRGTESYDFVNRGLAPHDEELLADGFAQHLDVAADSLIVEVESAHAVLVLGLIGENDT